jgi:predicted kinase
MTVLIATRGIVGSGKTTRARAWVAEDPVGRARVNRDDIRSMAHDGAWVARDDSGPGTERAVLAVRDAAITALLGRGVDVVCDDTNLPSRTVRDLRRLAADAGAGFEVWDLTDVPLDECIRRDTARPGRARVGEHVARDQHARFVAGRPWPLPLPDEPGSAAPADEPYVPLPDAPPAVLVDLDGTAAVMCDRSPYDETRVSEDTPNEPVLAAVRGMRAMGYDVVFCSGRTDGCRAATEAWLNAHTGIPYVALLMRRAGDQRADAVVKRELFDAHIRGRYAVVAVFDDRDSVVAMWRAMGLTVFQVAPGDF